MLALAVAHLALDQVQLFEGFGGVLGQQRVVQPMGDVEQRAAGIVADHVEDVPGTRGEPLDAHLAVDEDRGDVGGGDQVLQVVVDLAGLVDLALELVVDGGELFVDRLQLFLAGFQLLGGRAQFLVDRLQLLVGGAQFLGGGFRVLHGDLQALLGVLQFRLELGQDAVLGVRILQRAAVHAGFHFVEQHQHVVAACLVVAERAHHHVHVVAAAVAFQTHAPCLHALAGVGGLVQRGAQFEAQLGMHQGGQVQ